MPKFNGVRDDDGFGVSVDDLKTAIVGEGGADVVAVSPAESPQGAFVGFVVDEHGASARAEGSGVKVEGRVVEVFPY